jgi:hypothetical protein
MTERSTADDGWQTYEGSSDPETGSCDRPVMPHVCETEVRVENLRDMGPESPRSGMIMTVLYSHLHISPDKSKPEEIFYGNVRWSVLRSFESLPFRRGHLLVSRSQSMAELNSVYKYAGLVRPTWALEGLEESKWEGPTKENRENYWLPREKQGEMMSTILDAVACGQVY